LTYTTLSADRTIKLLSIGTNTLNLKKIDLYHYGSQGLIWEQETSVSNTANIDDVFANDFITFHLKKLNTTVISVSETYMVEEDPFNFLPSSLDELVALGKDITSVPCLREVVTLTPPHSNVKHNILPLFVLPGISADMLSPFLSHLMHPAYCAPLAEGSHSTESLAEALLQVCDCHFCLEKYVLYLFYV
jgi:hypothetical protein